MKVKVFFQKIFEGVTYLKNIVIPYNKSYRPTGFYWTVVGENSFLASENAKYVEVFSGDYSDLEELDLFYNLCCKELKPQIFSYFPTSFIVEIPKGRLWQNINGTSIAIVSQNNQLVGEVSYQFAGVNKVASIKDHDIFKQQYFVGPTKYKGVVFSMLSGSAATNNYFSWLFDSLPRLYLLKESGLFDKVDFFLVPSMQEKYHRQTLQLLGIDEKRIVECKGLAHVEADTLLVSSSIRYQGHIPTWVHSYHKKAFLKNEISEDNPANALIYIKRGDAKIRQIINEVELMNFLESRGFKSFSLSELSNKEQARLFASARIIVSAHGAGLANLSFCNKGTSIIELYPMAYIKPTYQIISKALELDYHYIICKTDSAKQPRTSKNARLINLYVDVNKVENMLNGILAESEVMQ